ncbi:hypothetical protein [Microbacterium natoriense]|uniref:hypothetical protein n=1 Tax=Microbacterium natoriense TaxID=284570 RepID=UPI0027D89A5D|nr:hypothetical protein [Microbacterium natoriense]
MTIAASIAFAGPSARADTQAGDGLVTTPDVTEALQNVQGGLLQDAVPTSPISTPDGTAAVGGTPASAEEVAQQADLVDEIVLDAAAGEDGSGDATIAQIDEVTAVIPADLSRPVTVESEAGTTIELILPQGDGSTRTVPDIATITHDLNDGSSIVPVVRSNGVLQVLSVINDASSPTSFVYGVTADSGGSMSPLPDGGVGVLSAAGKEVAIVAPPWAKDANGQDIPTRFELDGNKLTQIVDTASVPSATYPVVADPAVSVKYTKYTVIDLVPTKNWTNKARQLGICKIQAGAGGGTCSNSYSVSTSIQTSLGATVGDVSAGIGFNASKSVTGTVTWTSGKAAAGTTYKAWAVGTRVTYKVQKWTGYKTLGMKTPNWRIDSTSGTLTAFSPVVGFAVSK